MSEELDLDTLEQKTSAELVVKHPITGEPTAARILIAGPEHALRRSAIFQRMRARRAEVERTGKLSMPDPEDEDADEANLLAACTLGWSGLSTGGQPVVYTADAARALYSDPRRRWLRDQVKAALDQRELFIGSSATA